MEIGSKEDEAAHPVAWRLGPNPRLTNFAFIAALCEMLLLFIRKPLDPQKYEFLIATLISGALFFWLTVVWIGWFVYQGIIKIRKRSTRKVLGYTAKAGAVLLCTLYAACWANFLYSGTFPDAEMFSFLVNGSASELDFMLSVIEQTIPHAGLYAVATCGLLAITIPLGISRLRNSHWGPNHQSGEGATKLLTWIIPGLACLFFYGMTQSDVDFYQRVAATSRLKTQASPTLSLIYGLVDGSNREPIAKEIDMQLLRAITPVPPPSAADLTRTATAPNVIFLAVESLRADMLGKQHQGRLVMPNMTALAEKSLVFTKAHSQATHTDYSITSYLSSQYPMRSLRHYHPVANAGFPKTMIYEWLKRYGYATGIITSDNTDWCGMANFMFSPDLDVFFDSRNMPTTFSTRLRGYSARKPESVNSRGATLIDDRAVDYANAWLTDRFQYSSPVFLHLMFQRTHFSYPDYPGSINPFQPATMDFTATFDAYPRDKVEIVRNAYYNAAYNVDIQLGRLLNHIENSGELDNTIVVVIGDHGEGFFEHSYVTHSRLPFEEFSHIPMIIYLPPPLAKKFDAPRHIDYPTEQIDAAPIICGLLGIPPSPAFQGINVLSKDRPALENRFTYTHVEAPGQASGECVIQAGRWKYMQDRLTGIDYLFDLESDPAEKVDIKSANPRITTRLRNKLQLWRNSHLTYYKYNMYYEHYYQPCLANTAVPQ